MALIVQKFGGSSVADVSKIRNVANRVTQEKENGNQVVVVVSALGDTTDDLVKMAYQLNGEPNEREMDMLMSTGEQISISLLSIAIHALGHDAISLTGAQVGILTDSAHTKAKILDISDTKLRQELDKGKIIIVAGFQGIDEHNNITTLGRGGSDTTAVAVAAALKADRCDIYTDVDGVYTCDPRIVKDARKLDKICHDEMLELASLGAKVLQSRSVEFAKKFNVPLQVRSSFTLEEGTYIVKEANSMEDPIIRGIAINKDEAKITIKKVKDEPGVAAGMFQEIADNNLNIDMIIQNVGEGDYTDISFTVLKTDLPKGMKVLKAIAEKIGAGDVVADENVAKISIVGVGMKSHTGVAAKMFKTLADEKINISIISTSEIKISCLIPEVNADKAAIGLHKAFGLSDEDVKLSKNLD